MSNPYESPIQQPMGESIQQQIRAPATALLVVSSIAVVMGILGLVVDGLLIGSGTVDQLEKMNQGPVSEQTQITIRIVWGIVLLIASSFVLYGAIKMRKMESYGVAKVAAIVAMIPLVGPCCLLGIPFGLWALIALSKPGVEEGFR